jgi:hypothetical protein
MADRPLQSQQDSVLVPVFDAPHVRSYNSGAGLYFEQSYINCYPETYKPLGYVAPDIAAIKRSGSLSAGMTTAIATAAGVASDVMVPLANIVVTQLYDVYVAAFFESTGNTIKIIQYRVAANSAVLIGTINFALLAVVPTINDMVFITEIVNGDTLLPGIAVSYQTASKAVGAGLYAITLAGVFTVSSLTVIASGSFPSNFATPRIITGPFQQMNGNIYIMTIDGFIYNSGLTALGGPDVTSWNTNGSVSASQYPDRGVGVYRYKHLLIACGQDSIEFWSPDNLNVPQSPLVRTDQAFIKFGAASPKLIINVDDILYWVSYGSTDTIGVWKLDGYTPTKISTQREDVLLMNAANVISYPSYFTMEAVLINSRKHLIINGIASYSLLYTALGMTTASVGDTFPMTSTNDGRGTIQCFNIADQMWWSMNMCNNGDCYIVATTAYPSNVFNTAGQYTQYFFRRRAGSSGQDSVCSARPIAWVVNGAEGTFYDDVPTATLQPITVAITFNTIWNTTTKRKGLRKISAMMDTLTKASGDNNIYTFYFLYNKSGNYQGATTDTNIRGLPLPAQNTTNIASRYYVNNLGMYRQLNLGIAWKSRDAFRMQGLELEVAGGTS